MQLFLKQESCDQSSSCAQLDLPRYSATCEVSRFHERNFNHLMYESMEQTITIIQFRCNEGMDNALSLSNSDSDSANRMKRTRKSATYVVDMWNKGEV